MDMNATGAFLRERRTVKGLTQADVAERLGMSAQAVSNWERGETLPDASILMDLALIYETSVDLILGGGREAWRFRRRVTVAQLREVLYAVRRMGEILGRDHFIYRTMIDALDSRMNAEIERAFSNESIMDAYIGECAIECAKNGDYIDPSDLKANLHNQKALEVTLARLRERGIR